MVEHFTREEFEAALPRDLQDGSQLWVSLGLVTGEFTYRIVGPDNRTAIEVRSSVQANGTSASSGEDSIRCWLVDARTGQPLGSKVSRWTTRLPGWQERMQDVLRTLWRWRLRAGDCPRCNQPKGIFKVKKDGKNKGRPYAKCTACDDGFAWLDQPTKPYLSPDTVLYRDFSGADEPETDESNQGTMTSSVPETAELSPNEPPASPPTGGSDSAVSAGTEPSQAQSHPPIPGVQPPVPGSVPAFLSGKQVILPEGESEEAPTSIADSQKREPNAEQRLAIEAPVEAAVRVLAPPGSGKTFVLAHRYAHLLEHGAEPDDVLAVTFSKSMADELLERIARVSPQVRGTEAERQVCTIHAACYRMLRANGDRRKVAATGQIKRTLQDIAERLWPYADERPGWEEIALWINNVKAHGLTSADDLTFFTDYLGSFQGRNLHQARRDFDETMQRAGLITFPDMLLDVEVLLRTNRAFREKWQARFQWVIVDEGQDTSGQAMRILTCLAEPQNRFFICGDSDQLLFRFTGATPEANLFGGFETRYPGGIMVKLTTNYRSTRAIISACQHLIEQNYSEAGGPYDQLYLKEVQARPDAPEGEPVTFTFYEDVYAEAQALTDALVEQLSNGRLPGHVFVGARTRAQLGYLEGSLVRAQIPFINIAGGSFWDSMHVKNVIAYLRLAVDATNDIAFQRVFNIATKWFTHPWGEHRGEYCHHRYLGRAFLDACSGSFRNIWRAADQRRAYRPGVEDLSDFVNELKAVATSADDAGQLIRFILDNCYLRYLKADEGLSSTDEAEDGKVADLETVADIASQFSDVRQFLAYVDEAIKAAEAAKEKSWDDFVVLSTVHRLKGLERPVVYGIGLCEGTDAQGRPAGLLPHTFSLTEPPVLGVLPTGGRGRIEDERCIAFVLVSRAMEEAHLSGCSQYRTQSLLPSRFVLELNTGDQNDRA